MDALLTLCTNARIHYMFTIKNNAKREELSVHVETVLHWLLNDRMYVGVIWYSNK